jgi:hypothetical protein
VGVEQITGEAPIRRLSTANHAATAVAGVDQITQPAASESAAFRAQVRNVLAGIDAQSIVERSRFRRLPPGWSELQYAEALLRGMRLYFDEHCTWDDALKETGLDGARARRALNHVVRILSELLENTDEA